MWFGTNNGLIRYDGYKMRVYKYDPDNDNSINDNHIRCLLEDKFRRLWIGTGGGLNVLNLKTEDRKSVV